MWLKEQIQTMLEYVCELSLKWMTRENALVSVIQLASGRLAIVRKK